MSNYDLCGTDESGQWKYLLTALQQGNVVRQQVTDWWSNHSQHVLEEINAKEWDQSNVVVPARLPELYASLYDAANKFELYISSLIESSASSSSIIDDKGVPSSTLESTISYRSGPCIVPVNAIKEKIDGFTKFEVHCRLSDRILNHDCILKRCTSPMNEYLYSVIRWKSQESLANFVDKMIRLEESSEGLLIIDAMGSSVFENADNADISNGISAMDGGGNESVQSDLQGAGGQSGSGTDSSIGVEDSGIEGDNTLLKSSTETKCNEKKVTKICFGDEQAMSVRNIRLIKVVNGFQRCTSQSLVTGEGGSDLESWIYPRIIMHLEIAVYHNSAEIDESNPERLVADKSIVFLPCSLILELQELHELFGNNSKLMGYLELIEAKDSYQAVRIECLKWIHRHATSSVHDGCCNSCGHAKQRCPHCPTCSETPEIRSDDNEQDKSNIMFRSGHQCFPLYEDYTDFVKLAMSPTLLTDLVSVCMHLKLFVLAASLQKRRLDLIIAQHRRSSIALQSLVLSSLALLDEDCDDINDKIVVGSPGSESPSKPKSPVQRTAVAPPTADWVASFHGTNSLIPDTTQYCECCRSDWVLLAELLLASGQISANSLTAVESIFGCCGVAITLSTATSVSRSLSGVTSGVASARDQLKLARKRAAKRLAQAPRDTPLPPKSPPSGNDCQEISVEVKSNSTETTTSLPASLSNSQSMEIHAGHQVSVNVGEHTPRSIQSELEDSFPDLSDDQSTVASQSSARDIRIVENQRERQWKQTSVRLQWKLGQVYMDIGEYKAALQYFQSAHEILNSKYQLDESLAEWVNQDLEYANQCHAYLKHNSNEAELLVDLGCAQSLCLRGTTGIVTLKEAVQYCCYYFDVAHPVTLKGINGLRVALDKSVFASSYHDLFAELLDLRRVKVSFGPTHEQFLSAFRSAATCLARVGDFDVARTMLKQCAETVKSIHGATSPNYLITIAEYCRILDEVGAYEDSLPLRIHLAEHTKNINRDLYLQALQGLCLTMQSNGQTFQAKVHFASAGIVISSAFGSHSDAYLHFLKLYSNFIIQKYLNETKIAVQVLTSLLELQTLLLGEFHEQTLLTRAHIAAAYERDECYHEEALAAHQFLVAKRAEVGGPESAPALQAKLNYASFLNTLGCWQESLELYENVAACKARTLGDDHRDVVKILSTVTALLRDLDRFEEANLLEARLLKQFSRSSSSHNLGFNTNRVRVVSDSANGEGDKLSDQTASGESLAWVPFVSRDFTHEDSDLARRTGTAEYKAGFRPEFSADGPSGRREPGQGGCPRRQTGQGAGFERLCDFGCAQM